MKAYIHTALFLFLCGLTTAAHANYTWSFPQTDNTETTFPYGDPTTACEAKFNSFSDVNTAPHMTFSHITKNGSNYRCHSQTSYTGWYTRPSPTTCPAGQEPHESGDWCIESPEPECPPGQVDLGNGCENQCSEGAEVQLVQAIEDISASTTEPRLGCTVTLSPDQLPKCNWDTGQCDVTYIDSGVYDENFTDPETEPEPVIEPDEPPKTTKEQDYSDPVTSTEPDGTTVTEQTVTTTETKNQGTNVEQVGDDLYITNQSGEVIEVIRNTTYKEYPDGTAEEITETTTNATPSTNEEVKKNIHSAGTETRSYTKGQSGSTTTTTTKFYNDSGDVTGTTSETTGDTIDTAAGTGTGEGSGESGSAFCDYASIVCESLEWMTEPFDEPEALEMPSADIQPPSDFDSGVGIAQCPAPIAVSTMFGTIQISWEWVCALAEQMRPILIAFSWIIGIFMVVRAP